MRQGALEAGFYDLQVFFVPVLVVLAVVLGAFVAYTLLGRYLYERRNARLARERLRVEDVFRRLETEAPREELRELMRATLDGVGGPDKVALVRMIGAMHEPKRSLYLDLVRRYEGWGSLSRRALRSPFKWRRIEAIGVLGEIPDSEVLDTLARCLKDDDDDIIYATMRALARRRELYAAELLMGLFGTDKADPKRVVTMIESFPLPTEKLVWGHLGGRNSRVRTGAAIVLETSKEPGSVARLVRAAGDPDADVRSAAIRSLATIADPRAKEVLPGAFEDEAWFVRASAARLAGALEATEFSEQVVRLLRDRAWWVRQNAKTALLAMCPEVEDRLERYLAAEDRFVRNMVAEILDASGVVQRRAAELERDPDSKEARRFFERLLAAEGRGSIEGLAHRASPGLRGVLLEILGAEAAQAS